MSGFMGRELAWHPTGFYVIPDLFRRLVWNQLASCLVNQYAEKTSCWWKKRIVPAFERIGLSMETQTVSNDCTPSIANVFCKIVNILKKKIQRWIDPHVYGTPPEQRKCPSTNSLCWAKCGSNWRKKFVDFLWLDQSTPPLFSHLFVDLFGSVFMYIYVRFLGLCICASLDPGICSPTYISILHINLFVFIVSKSTPR